MRMIFLLAGPVSRSCESCCIALNGTTLLLINHVISIPEESLEIATTAIGLIGVGRTLPHPHILVLKENWVLTDRKQNTT